MKNYSEIIQKIESLNSKSANDFLFYATELNKIIMDLYLEIHKETINSSNIINEKYLNENNNNNKEIELKENRINHYERENSLEILKDIYNGRCKEFNDNFYEKDELFRYELRRYIDEQNSKISKQQPDEFWANMYWPKFARPMPIIHRRNKKNNSDSYDPRFLEKIVVERIQNGYYLKPKPEPKSKEGCFIASYAFDDYNNKNVISLRLFRDEFLSNYYLGKLFIRFYYLTSPQIVIFFKLIKFPKLLLKIQIKLIIRILKKFNLINIVQ